MPAANRIVLKRHSKVILSCRTPSCRTPLVVQSGRNVHFAGRPGLGYQEDGLPVMRGNCPSCHKIYEVVDPLHYIPRSDSE